MRLLTPPCDWRGVVQTGQVAWDRRLRHIVEERLEEAQDPAVQVTCDNESRHSQGSAEPEDPGSNSGDDLSADWRGALPRER